MANGLLFLKSIQCIEQNETSQDEPYLNFGSYGKIWSGDMHQGDTVNLSNMDPLLFNNAADLSLWEEDNPGSPSFEHNDYIGTYTVSLNDAPGGPFSVDFTGGDAHYKLWMDVTTV